MFVVFTASLLPDIPNLSAPPEMSNLKKNGASSGKNSSLKWLRPCGEVIRGPRGGKMRSVNPHYLSANKEFPLSAVPFYCRKAVIHQKIARLAASNELPLKLLSLQTLGEGKSGTGGNCSVCEEAPWLSPVGHELWSAVGYICRFPLLISSQSIAPYRD